MNGISHHRNAFNNLFQVVVSLARHQLNWSILWRILSWPHTPNVSYIDIALSLRQITDEHYSIESKDEACLWRRVNKETADGCGVAVSLVPTYHAWLRRRLQGTYEADCLHT